MWLKIYPDAKLWQSGKVEQFFSVKCFVSPLASQELSGSRAAWSLLTGRGWKLNRWQGLRLWTLGYNHMQPNLGARIVWVIGRDPLSPSHTAARISDRQSSCFRRSRRGDIFTVNDVYCGPIKSLICHSTKSLFVLLPCRRWAVRLRVSIIKPSHRVTCRIKKKDKTSN